MMTRRIQTPTVALVGRTNVGKSTLFNKILEEERAIVSSTAGTTRDRNYGVGKWRGVHLQFVDTGGLDVGKEDSLEEDVVRQVQYAAKEADIILFVVDLTVNPLPQDRTLAHELTKQHKPILLVGNKADNPRTRANAFVPEWQRLRLGDVYAVSGKNGTGVGDLLDTILQTLGVEPPPQAAPETRIALVGRPNVGKSSLVNKMCREERVIVSHIAGTTREPQDTLITMNDHRYLLVDTVGLRRNLGRTPSLEKSGVEKTERAIQRADVLLFIIDSTAPITSQDRVLAGLVERSGKAVVLVMNKWDAVPNKNAQTITMARVLLERELPFFRFAPMVFTSALKGDRVDDIFPLVSKALIAWRKELPPKALDSFFRKMLTLAAKSGQGRPFIYALRQTGIEPPTFQIAVRGKEPIPDAFIRFVENRMREKFDFVGTPLRVRGKTVQVKPR